MINMDFNFGKSTAIAANKLNEFLHYLVEELYMKQNSLSGSRMPKRTTLSEEQLRRLIEDDKDEDLSFDSDGDPKDKDWVPDKDGSSSDKATATELDVVDDQASVETRNTEQHLKRKKETYIDRKKKLAARQEYTAQKTQKNGDPKDKDWVPDKDGSSSESDGETPNQESLIEVDISAPDPTFPEATATELDVADDQASVETRNTEQHPKRKKETYIDRKKKRAAGQEYTAQKTQKQPTEIHFRYDYDSDFSVIKVNESRRRMTPNKNSLELISAYKGPIPLPPAKYKDLMDLCHTLVIPRTFHEYYAALPSSESIRDALDESNVEEEDPEDL
ncbi:hypothetical protein QYM36_004680 [Artemia franciscana]|uniref:Uncharacterized protein n=1 Tax=Artemia franciscana TaxID=6661 RepID=A0AA88I6Q0_ARTSF|nr:hypothetical protein QYM36_004680 [Artemia franciscana]